MAHTCPYCDSLCHCKGDIDDIDLGREPSGGCIHYKRESCDEFGDDDDDLPEDWGPDYDAPDQAEITHRLVEAKKIK